MIENLYLFADYFALDQNKSDHGIAHWERVKIIGEYLSQYTKADLKVVQYFAFLHDIKREDDFGDPEHGLRAVNFIETHLDLVNDLTGDQIEKLKYACCYHSDYKAKSEDVTVQTCWDADRLDLCRVGIVPDKYFLNTDKAKEKESIEFSEKLFKSKE